MSNNTLPEILKMLQGHEPVAANALADGDYVSCKNLKKLWIVVQHYGGGGDTDLVLSLKEATTVAGGSAAAITETFPIWANADTASADTLTRQTDAANYTIDTGDSKDHLVVIEWDPSKFSDGFDCVCLSSSGGNASNIASVLYLGDTRYKSDSPPAAITD